MDFWIGLIILGVIYGLRFLMSKAENQSTKEEDSKSFEETLKRVQTLRRQKEMKTSQEIQDIKGSNENKGNLKKAFLHSSFTESLEKEIERQRKLKEQIDNIKISEVEVKRVPILEEEIYSKSEYSDMLSNHDSLKKAFVASEILGKPLALKE